ncbi:hypothetical protein D3C80_1845670 [compost metagenome]
MRPVRSGPEFRPRPDRDGSTAQARFGGLGQVELGRAVAVRLLAVAAVGQWHIHVSIQGQDAFLQGLGAPLGFAVIRMVGKVDKVPPGARGGAGDQAEQNGERHGPWPFAR